jgi:RNA polymerase sigma factor (sigma-70 family)
MRQRSDAWLAQRAASGDERAFAAIYRRYNRDLYRFCLSILGRPEDAQEALQNTMVKALRKLPGETREIELKPWLYRVAHNESIELMRRRREEVELAPEQAATLMAGPAETAVLRERTRKLFTDLGELPERQRSALVMRELGGLGFEQIGEAFGTSAGVARQTVYEARLNLRQLEAGREMSCERVTEQLSAADGRVTRRRDIQAHLRSCAECRAFRDSIDSRRRDLAAIAPLPAAAAASILHGLLGGKAAAGGIGAAGAGAGGALTSSVAVKAVATVAVVATVGVTAADRGGLVDVRLPGDKSGKQVNEGAQAAPGGEADPAGSPAPAGAPANRVQSPSEAVAPADRAGPADKHSGGKVGEPRAQAGEQRSATGTDANDESPGSLPAASQHGQETAASHKANGASKQTKSRHQGGTSRGHGAKNGSSRSHEGRSHEGTSHPHGKPAHAGGGNSGSSKPTNPPGKTTPPGKSEDTPGNDGSGAKHETGVEQTADSTPETESSP